MDSFYVMDFSMEYDKDLNSPYFPEYRTRLASKIKSINFFNENETGMILFYI